MNKNAKKYLVVIGIIFVLYNVLVWVIPFPKKDMGTFSIVYVSSIIALLSQPIIYYIAIYNNDTLRSKLYGLPILKIGYIYGIVQIAISIFFYLLGTFICVPVWISAVLCIFIFGFMLIGLLITDSYKEEIEKMESSAPLTKKFISNLKIDSMAFANEIITEPMHSEILKFAELVKYSDPISSDSLVDLEDEIDRKYIEIKELVINNQKDEALKELKSIYRLMEERNNRCKANKK